MNCRDFITEFEERRDLTETARLHINECSGCQKTSRTQTHIWKAIDDFTKVEAPKNFEFAVKARIADSKKSTLQPKFLPVLRYVLPLGLIVLVAGLLAFNTSLFFGGNNAPQIGQIAPQQQVATSIPLNNFSPPTAAPAENVASLPTDADEAFIVNASNQTRKPAINKQKAQFVSMKSVRKSSNNLPKLTVKNSADNGGGSIDTAVTTPKVLTPEGFNQAAQIENPSKNGTSTVIGIDNILSVLGVEAVSENGRQIVKTVKQNSTAARSGLKVGDAIEAVDGVKLSALPAAGGKVEVKTMTVLRGTEKIEILLKN